jgi:hypothetical protein
MSRLKRNGTPGGRRARRFTSLPGRAADQQPAFFDGPLAFELIAQRLVAWWVLDVSLCLESSAPGATVGP